MRVGWSASAGGRIVARRELTVDGNPGQASEASIRLQLPEVRPPTILAVVLALSIDGKTLLEKPLWVFPSDPFADQRKSLPALPITLFDPEGKTADRFKESEIPFSVVRNADLLLLADLHDGVIIIGEGTLFEDYRGLADRLVASAARGNRVLCLASTGGSFELSGLTVPVGSDLKALSLRKSEVITEFDKRLDSRDWPPDGKLHASGVNIVGERSRVLWEHRAGNTGWPWLEADFQHEGRLILCGFAVIDKWESSPVPRYLLRHMLDRIAKKKS